jgi:tetratricopeptide (TPR) repeat protein
MDFKETVALAYKVLGQGRENVDLSNFTRAYLLVAAGRGMLAYYGGPISKIANGTQILSNLKKAEELQPDSSGVLFGLGSFYFLAPPIAGGDRDKARRYLEEAVERDPLFADAYVRLGQLYRMMGEEEKYRQCIDKVMQIDPENALLLDMRKGECKFICISLEK